MRIHLKVALATGAVMTAALLNNGSSEPIVSEPQKKAEFVPLTWNVDLKQDGETYTQRMVGSWDNYHTSSGWKKIDKTVIKDVSGFHMTSAPFAFHAPLFASGNFRYIANSDFDEQTNSFFDEAPMEKRKSFPTADPVPGVVSSDCSILYANAFPNLNGDLCIKITDQSVLYLVRFNAEPSGAGNVEIPFRQSIPGENISLRNRKGEVISGTGADLAKGIELKRGKRRILTQEAHVWDSSSPSKSVPIKIIGFFNAKKIIPRSFLRNATYPVFTDATDTFTSDTADRGMTSDSNTFSVMRSGNNLTLEALNRTTDNVVCWQAGATYFSYRAYLWWPTGATLPSGAVFSSASLDIYFPGTHAAISRGMYLVENRQASSALATSDWSLIGASGVGTGTGEPFGTITRGVSEASGHEVFTINSDGQSKIAKGSGNTYFAIVESDDWDNTAPSAEDTAGTDFNFADAASNKPTLSVTYTIGAPAAEFVPVIVE